jgi:HdeA/HdeB family protein
MRAAACVILSVLTAAGAVSRARAQDTISLDEYTCADFLADSKNPTDGAKVIKSLMIIYWATGYAAAHDKATLRADTNALQLIATSLGEACRNDPGQIAVRAFARTVDQLTADSAQHPADVAVPSATAKDDSPRKRRHARRRGGNH